MVLIDCYLIILKLISMVSFLVPRKSYLDKKVIPQHYKYVNKTTIKTIMFHSKRLKTNINGKVKHLICNLKRKLNKNKQLLKTLKQSKIPLKQKNHHFYQRTKNPTKIKLNK